MDHSKSVKIPKKLKEDSIVEAVCEVRFSTTLIPELFLGRLADSPQWKGYTLERSSVTQIPDQIRQSDPNLKFQPVILMTGEEGGRSVRIGERVISLHVIGEYIGGDLFKQEIAQLLATIFEVLDNIEITRIGFRYANILTQERHDISGFGDLAVNLAVGDTIVTEAVNLNFLVNDGDSHKAITKIATPEFMSGNLKEDASVIVDIDVFTPVGVLIMSAEEANNWIDVAHEFEKKAFFSLFSGEQLNNLVEVW